MPARPAAHGSLSPWGEASAMLVPSPWTPGGTAPGAAGGRRLAPDAGTRENRDRDAFWRSTRSRPHTSRRSEAESRPTTECVLAPESESDQVGVQGRRLKSRGQARAQTTASPRWGRALTSRGSQFEEAVRIKQLEALPAPLTAPEGTRRRVKSGISGRARTAREHFATAPTMAEKQATAVQVVVQAFAPTENLPAAEMSKRNPLMLPECSHRERLPYNDLVRRQHTPRECLFTHDNLPDAKSLNKMRHKKLLPAGMGPLARGMRHCEENRGAVTRLCDFNNLDTDEESYLRSLEQTPNDRDALLGYASYLFRKSRLAEAENTYRRLLELPFHGRSDEHADAIHSYATFLWQTDRSEKAETMFLTGLKFNSEHFEMLHNCALVMFSRGAFSGACDKFQRACLLRPDDTRSKLGYVVCLERIGKSPREEIDQVYHDIFELNRSYPEALFSYALYCKNTSRRQLAKEYYERTLELTPGDATVLCSYGVLLSEEAFHDRSLFAKAEGMFAKALQQAPKDTAVIYSFAVTLSIKLRLQLYEAGATIQELEKSHEAIRTLEHEHHNLSNTVGVEPIISNFRQMRDVTQHNWAKQRKHSGKPKQNGGSVLINTLTGRPERMSEFRHEHVLDKHFENFAMDSAKPFPLHPGRSGRSCIAVFNEEQARLKLQAVARGHMARKNVEQMRAHCPDEGSITFLHGYTFDQAQALATYLFEEALALAPNEAHVLGAYAIFLFLVIATEPAIERAQHLFARALKMEQAGDARVMAICFLDLIRLHEAKFGKGYARKLAEEWELKCHETVRPLTPLCEFEARMENAKAEAYAQVYENGKDELSAKYPKLDLFPSSPRSNRKARMSVLAPLSARTLVMKESAIPYAREGWGMPPSLVAQ